MKGMQVVTYFDFFERAFKFSAPCADIGKAIRLSKSRPSGNKPRPIKVSMKFINIQNKVYDERKTLSKFPDG